MSRLTRHTYAKELVEISLAPKRSNRRWIACKSFIKRLSRPLLAIPLAQRLRALFGIDVTGEIAERQRHPARDRNFAEDVGEALASMRQARSSKEEPASKVPGRDRAIDLVAARSKHHFTPPALGVIASQLKRAGFEVALRETEHGLAIYVVDRRNKPEQIATHGLSDDMKIPEFLRGQAD